MTERPSNNSLLPPSIRKYLEESEEQIQAIKTVNDIKEVVGADAALLLVGERTPAICRLYATLVQEHERIIIKRTTQKVLDGLNAQDQILEQSRQRVEAELLRDLDELKNAIGQAQLISAFDRRRVHLASPYLLPLAITDQFPPWLPDRSPEATFLLSPTAWFDLCRRKNYARGMVIGATNVAKPDTGNATITPTDAPYAARTLPDTTLVPGGVPITDQRPATLHPISMTHSWTTETMTTTYGETKENTI
ncbi:hypothetical protein CC2G_006149 [Coprinopsis cinerea AmutBmut pab1-1]|nr:hypothetical protein CC2G_006149 [Coprinopsis cinerea AmutBmut pab1-1]